MSSPETHRRKRHAICPVKYLALILMLMGAPALPTQAKGNFTSLAWEPLPDLITLRGVEAIREANIILLEQPSEKEYWKDFIGDKEVWYCPHGARVGLGFRPKGYQGSRCTVPLSRGIQSIVRRPQTKYAQPWQRGKQWRHWKEGIP